MVEVDDREFWRSLVPRQSVPRPECLNADGLYYEEGCLKCKSCGASKCG